MEKIRALVPWEFFDTLLPFNAELLNGNAMVVRAFGAKSRDHSFQSGCSFFLYGGRPPYRPLQI